MKHSVAFLLVVIVLTGLSAGCDLDEVIVSGSGDVVTQEEDISGFDEVSASHNFEVNIEQGDSYEVVIRIDDNLLDDLEVTKRGDRLEIGFKRNIITRNATMEANITMPKLMVVDLSGASDAQITGFNSNDDFNSGLSGASSLSGDIRSGDVSLDLSGASEVTLSGSGGNLVIDASGSSDVDLAEFPVEDADLDLSGSSEIILNVNGTLDVSASGSSDVEYVGEPTLGSIDTSGSSSVSRR
jgi:hypothetical protein